MQLLNHLNIQYSPHNKDIKCECLWCGKDSLSIEEEAPHVFQCFSCKASGNAFTFIRKWYENLPTLTKRQALSLCSIKQGVLPVTLRTLGVRCYGAVYIIPVYNQKNDLVAVHKFVPDTNIVYNGPKPVSYSVLGIQNISNNDTVYIAEGHWDYFTLYPLIQQDDYDLLGSCGSYFPTNLLPHLKDKHVIMLFDNDEAGKNGVDYVAKHIKTTGLVVRSISYLDWSKVTIPSGAIPDKFDVRDLHNVFA
jgi:hypothetical protein